MNIKNHYIIPSLIGLMIGSAACTDNFESINTDKTGFTKEQQGYDYNMYGIPANVVQQGIYCNYNWGWGINWPFQIMQNLNADMFSGYLHDFQFGDKNSSYALQDGWNSSMWTYTYGYITPEAKRFEELAIENDQKPMIAVAKILKVSLMHRVCDLYGPIVYTTFGGLIVSSADSQQEAYNAFFNDLDEATSLLKEHIANGGADTFKNFDILMPSGKRTYAYWLKYANSLRLRLAMRISLVDKSKATSEIAKSLAANSGGVLEVANEVVATSTEKGYTNPLGTINKGWGEVYINANMESIMTGYEDPRLAKYFVPVNPDSLKTMRPNPSASVYRGIRQGTGVEKIKRNTNCSSSTISDKDNAILMTPAEVWFLRAEAALRGMSTNGDDAKICYEKGVKASFVQWGLTEDKAALYLESTNVPVKYVNPYSYPTSSGLTNFDVDPASTIDPKWNDGDQINRKMERIITQKWIACYPEGCEAWAEQRRTGFPVLFSIPVNLSGGTINSTTLIRRLPFPGSLSIDNPELYNTLKNKLNGADNGGTRLWWDVATKNF